MRKEYTMLPCEWCGKECRHDTLLFDDISGECICDECADSRDPQYDLLVKKQVEVDKRRSTFTLIKGGKE